MTTKKPQYFQGIAILFWGFQTDLWYFAIPMAAILEARYYINRRWALTKTDFYRVSDLTSFGLLAMVVFLSMNAREYHFITSLLSWLPILFFPLVAVLAYSTTPRMPLDVMFYSLRRQREPVQQSWDMDYVLLGACVLGAGLNKDYAIYFPIAAAIILGCLYTLRSPRFNRAIFVLTCCLVFVAATSVHLGIRGAHLGIKKKTEEWIAEWIAQRTDPYRTRTSIGYVGKLKLSDAIDFRIAPASGEKDFPPYLQEASYDSPDGYEWNTFDPDFKEVDHADDYRWNFVDRDPRNDRQAKIYIEFQRKQSLVPVPAELSEVNELPAKYIALSKYGSLKAEQLIPSPHYLVRYQDKPTISSPPTHMDLKIPEEQASFLADFVPGDIAEPDAIPFIHGFFQDFSYSLYQEKAAVAENPVEYFLTQSKAGHCEYFASATVMMLRQLGIPARYVVGYSISEWHDGLGMYIVRKRHAHAWATAWINNEWVVVDTTPSQWLNIEDAASNPLQPVFDFLSNNQFRFRIWWNDQKIEDYETELYILGFILVLILVWRIATSEQVIIENKQETRGRHWINPGEDSPFYQIESLLGEKGFRRSTGELMKNWLIRIGRPELLPMLATHNRWRFDPHGVSIEDRQDLNQQVSDWLSDNQEDSDSTDEGKV